MMEYPSSSVVYTAGCTLIWSFFLTYDEEDELPEEFLEKMMDAQLNNLVNLMEAKEPIEDPKLIFGSLRAVLSHVSVRGTDIMMSKRGIEKIICKMLDHYPPSSATIGYASSLIFSLSSGEYKFAIIKKLVEEGIVSKILIGLTLLSELEVHHIKLICKGLSHLLRFSPEAKKQVRNLQFFKILEGIHKKIQLGYNGMLEMFIDSLGKKSNTISS
eukprot:TRINITY_DN22785_c0_g1_i1.p1 TRINITY_DN22785_c0_g1~~TRINITY_DN22785_c0_g1_i1.p1  ORF type:complete len:215 (+),score=44.70 TRINITY_DN22785_c0_g1_i1:341-985(+)